MNKLVICIWSLIWLAVGCYPFMGAEYRPMEYLRENLPTQAKDFKDLGNRWYQFTINDTYFMGRYGKDLVVVRLETPLVD